MANLPLILFLTTIIIATHSTTQTTAQTDGFTVDLIHRDSPNSPFHNPNETPAQRLRNALTRSISRAHRHIGQQKTLSPQASGVNAPITLTDGAYLVNISLGTPPYPITAVADTGSNLIWTQCKPCDNCYAQDAELFDPESSTTYKTASCDSQACQAVDDASCSEDGSVCGYAAGYGDGSYTIGDVALETLTVGTTGETGRNVALPDTVIGCGHNNSGRFRPSMSGIVGLGRGPSSLVSQLGSSIAGKFSYCLVTYSAEDLTSTLSFGSNAVVSGAVTTPLISNPKDRGSTFYSVKLDAVSVGSERIPFGGGGGGAASGGDIIVDSGTTLTIVPSDFAKQLMAAVDGQVTGGRRVQEPTGLLGLCYEASADLAVPAITAHFGGEADVELAPENAFIKLSETTVCLAVRGDDRLGVSIYGNIAQQNFQIGYDLVGNTLSFKPADCAKI